MLIARNHLLGPSGAIGPVVVVNWKGQQYLRSRPSVSNRKPSMAQVIQRAKFSLGSRIIQSMKPLLAISYKEAAPGKSETNLALSRLLKGAMTGTYPDLRIDFSQLLVAYGNLPGVWEPEVSAAGKGALLFTWQVNSLIGIASPNDKAILVAYHPATNTTHYSIGEASRKSGKGILAIPLLKGEEVETYIAFVDAKGNEASLSVYTGRVRNV